MTKMTENELIEIAVKASVAGNELRDARLAEITANDNLAVQETSLILAGLEGKNEKERHAYLRSKAHTPLQAFTDAKNARIIAETKYSAAKRSLRIMELIYKVHNK